MSFKKKFKTAQTLRAWSIVSSHVLMSSVFTFRFIFWWLCFPLFLFLFFGLPCFPLFTFIRIKMHYLVTRSDQISCLVSIFKKTKCQNFLSCHTVWRVKMHCLCHVVWPKNKRKKLTKERNFVSHRSLASFLFSLVKRYHTDALSVPNWKLQLKKSSSYWGFWDFFSMTTWLTIRRQ